MEQKGTLYLVATPIGNLGDISERALTILSKVDVIAAEDTRVSRKLLSSKGISRKVISYYEGEKELAGRRRILHLLNEGKNVALVADAGSPGISDPGYLLVRDAVEQDIAVTSIPGSSAAICSLQLSALPSDRFAFFGFLPRKGRDRQKELEQIINFSGTVLFYESPRRLSKTLWELAGLFPDVKAAVCRELTKLHEEVARGTVLELAERFDSREIKGEVVVLIETPKANPDEEKAFALAVRLYEHHNLSVKDASQVASEFTGIGKKHIYNRLLKKKGS